MFIGIGLPITRGKGVGTAPPVNSVAPAVTGTTNVGDLLTCSTGTWSDAPSSYAYQWQRAGVGIGGATSSTYTLTVADTARTVTCKVIATNAGGASAPATSNGVAVPAPELVTNGQPFSATGWAAATGWTFAAGQAVATAVAAFSVISRSPAFAFETGVTYTSVLDVASIAANSVRVAVSGGTQVSQTTRSSVAVFTEDFVSLAGNNLINLQAIGSLTGAFNSLSIKKKVIP